MPISYSADPYILTFGIVSNSNPEKVKLEVFAGGGIHFIWEKIL
jgi:hypothetical protein